MIYGVVITDPALDDIAGIVSYIWDLTGNERTAEGYMYGILKTAKSLDEMRTGSNWPRNRNSQNWG